MEMNRRNLLATAGGSVLAASALSLAAPANAENQDENVYGHGMVWNKALPGVLSELKLSFDLNVNPQTGVGLGTAHDPDHPEWGMHYDINSIVAEKAPKGERRLTMKGVVTSAIDPARVGETVAIIAETVGDSTVVAVRVGELAFGGAGYIISVELLFITVLLILGLIAGWGAWR